MATEGTRHLFVLSFPDETGAALAVGELHELSRDMFIKLGDYAIITKGVDGALTVTENPTSDPSAKRGALTGGIGMGLVALAGPIGIGAVAVGAGIGAVAGALMDSGFKSKDLDEVGRADGQRSKRPSGGRDIRRGRHGSGACSTTSRP